MKAARSGDTRIPRRPLLWLAAALVFTLPSMFGALAQWVPTLFLFTLAAKFWMEPKGYRLRSVPLKLVLAGMAVMAVLTTYGAITGIAPGVSIVVVMMALKIVEAHTAREFQIMVLAAWMLCLCGFILSQDLALTLSLTIAFVLLLVALVQFHGGLNSPFLLSLRTGGKLLLQALPLVALSFLLFPRITTGFRLQISPSRAVSGFSDHLSPGSVSSLANSSDVAFRAEFPEGNAPIPSKMYWRGIVMWQGEGLEWQASETPGQLSRTGRPAPAGRAIKQRITIEPHGGQWMFGLDWPAEPSPGVALAPGNYLWSAQPIRKQRIYDVRSFPEIREKELRPRERNVLLELKGPISSAAWKLAQSWKTDKAAPREIVRRALEFFRTHGFRYSLTPGEYKAGDLDEFLFQRRLGFCEHYAAGFATLMRMAGIPARVVTGYLGGEYNELGGFFLVRQSDAHAWCEVWLPDSGWERVDPTSVVAPDRISLGLNAFLQNRTAAGQSDARRLALIRGLGNWPGFKQLRLAWQTLSYQWDTRVLGFDGDAQQSFFEMIGLKVRGPLPFLIGLFLIAVILLRLNMSWMRWRSTNRADKVRELYSIFCGQAARLGAARDPSEGPLHFSERAARLLPNEATHINNIARNYISLRYSGRPDLSHLHQLSEDVKSFSATLIRAKR